MMRAPMGNRIEVAKSGRSKCVTCDEVIPKGGVRLAEETRDIGIPDLIHRFYHLKCAAAVHPEVVAHALQHVDDGVDFDRAEIEAKIAPAIARATEARKQKYLEQVAEREAKQVKVVEYDDTTSELLSQLDDNPEDPGTLAVVADQLQARGDIRGELIALQLAAGTKVTVSLEGDDDEETDASERVSESQRRSRRTAELMEKLSVPLDAGDKAVWGVGFIKRLELLQKNGTRLSALGPIWKHPSLRFLSELRLTFASNMDATFITRMHEFVPRSLRRLELGDISDHALSGTAAFVAQLPRLDTLTITGKSWISRAEPLVHPTLRAIEIGILDRYLPTGVAHYVGTTDLAGQLPFLSPKHLPALTALALRPGNRNGEPERLADVVTWLGPKWFKQLTTFGWLHAPHPSANITGEDVAALAKALGKKKLAKLDLTGTKVPLALRDKLAALCAELVAPDLEVSDDQTVFVEHTAKPEWGRGKLVRRKEGKVEVQFPKPVGLKVFKADAPFLKMHA